jgi:hypothetical protein
MTLARHLPNRHYKFIAIVTTLIIIIIIQYYVYRVHLNEISEISSPICSYSYTIDDKRIMFDSPLYSIHHYPEFICPQNFRNMADWIYGWPEGVFHEEVHNSIHDTVTYLPHGSIIYIKTDSLPEFFSEIYPHFRNKFVLITGQGDLQAPGQFLHYLERNHSKIIHWFGQNGNIDASVTEYFTHIPIGKDILM